MKSLNLSYTSLHCTLLLLAFSLILPASAWAHKIHIFAYESDGTIISEAKFNNGKPAKGGTVEVYDGESKILRGTTNEKGIFSFPIPEVGQGVDLTITVNTGDGHRAEWLLLAEEYQFDVIEKDHHPAEQLKKVEVISTNQLNDTETFYVLNTEQIRLLITEEVNKEVAEQLAPIKRKLAEQQQSSSPTTRDILAGIGIIFGLMGLLAYFKSKKH